MADEKKAEEKKAVKDEKPVEKSEVKAEAKIDEKTAEVKETKTAEKPEAKTETKKDEKPKKEKKEKKSDKDEKKVDIVSENVYTIPLTKVHQTKPCYKRTKKAITAIITYLNRHTKSENIKIDDGLNKHIWSRGNCKPPRRVQIKAVKDSDGKVVASLLK